MKKTLLLLAAVGAVAFALVGCQPAEQNGEEVTTTTTTGNDGTEVERETTRTTTPGGY